MAVRPAAHPTAPFTAPGGDLQTQLNAIAMELNKKANAGEAGPAVHFIGMIDPTGATWRLSVDASGALHTEQVPRS